MSHRQGYFGFGRRDVRADRGIEKVRGRSLPIRRFQVGERSPRSEDLPGFKNFRTPVPDWLLLLKDDWTEPTQRPQHTQRLTHFVRASYLFKAPSILQGLHLLF